MRASRAALRAGIVLLAAGGLVWAATLAGFRVPAAQVGVSDADGVVTLGPQVWTAQTGAGGWGNHELQSYTQQAVQAGPDGGIRITARIPAWGGTNGITSGRITSAGKWSFRTGTLTARIKLPDGRGLLPAFWLLGDNLYSAGWPQCGEIDIVETPKSTLTSVHSVHGPSVRDPRQQWQLNVAHNHPQPLSAGFHDYSVTRVPDRLIIGVDGVVIVDLRRAALKPGQRWVFDQPFHVVFSLAVGGDWPGPPDATTPRVATMEIAWLRYRPDVSLPAAPAPS